MTRAIFFFLYDVDDNNNNIKESSDEKLNMKMRKAINKI